MNNRENNRGLCYRCEHRAKFLEEGIGPRAECKDKDMAVRSCYMYLPVVPLRLEPNEGDKRPPIGPYFITARSHRVGIVTDNQEFILDSVINDDKSFTLFWRPKSD